MPRIAALLLAAALLCAGSAAADSISLPCLGGTCQGGTYWLLYSGSPIATDALTETYRITFRMDTEDLTIDDVYGVDTVAVKITNGSSLVGGSLFDAPLGDGNWSGTPNVGLNADGCSGGGGGFYCAEVAEGGSVPPVGGILEWVFDLRIEKGTLFTDLLDASVKARFVDAEGNKVGDLLSEGATLHVVPEPGSLALLGIGLLGLASLGRPGAA